MSGLFIAWILVAVHRAFYFITIFLLINAAVQDHRMDYSMKRLDLRTKVHKIVEPNKHSSGLSKAFNIFIIGKIAGGIIQLIGVAIIALPTGILASGLKHTLQQAAGYLHRKEFYLFSDSLANPAARLRRAQSSRCGECARYCGSRRS